MQLSSGLKRVFKSMAEGASMLIPVYVVGRQHVETPAEAMAAIEATLGRAIEEAKRSGKYRRRDVDESA